MYEIPEKEILIGASLSCANLYDLKTELKKIEEAGIDYIHYDVIDGRFNDTFILGIPTLMSIRPHTKLPIEVHLAVYNPQKFIKQFVEAGADYIAFHYEATDDPASLCEEIKSLKAKPVLALKAETDINKNLEGILPLFEWVLKLTVNPGYSGQKIKPESIEKIKKLKEGINKLGLPLKIAADGNINEKTIPDAVKAGSRMLVGGTSGLFLKTISLREAKEKMLEKALKYIK